mgnify:CR=1 FL=1
MRAAFIAFSMYSRIPMPMFEWKEEDMKYAMCFFPAIGMVIGAVFYGMFLLLSWLLPGSVLAAGILLAVPIFITGGIHMDGFMDTCDARASYGDREKKLAILKDTHTGAFAVIFGALYLILYAAACLELERETAMLVSIGFVISRSLSGLSTVTFPEARKHGMLADFMKDARKKTVAVCMLVIFFLTAFLELLFGGICGGVVVITTVLIFLWYRHMAVQEFGGVTGDLAGFFLQICELGILLAAVIGKAVF